MPPLLLLLNREVSSVTILGVHIIWMIDHDFAHETYQSLY